MNEAFEKAAAEREIKRAEKQGREDEKVRQRGRGRQLWGGGGGRGGGVAGEAGSKGSRADSRMTRQGEGGMEVERRRAAERAGQKQKGERMGGWLGEWRLGSGHG